MITTASRLDREFHCYGPLHLPHVERTDDDSEAGNARHRYLKRASEVGPDAALAEVPEEHRETCASIDIERLRTMRLAHEIAFALNLENGDAAEIGRGLERAYPVARLSPFTICGTADVIGLAEDHVWIPDYKGPGNKTPARDSHQFRFLALCATRAYDRPRAIVERLRLMPDGGVIPDRHTYTELDLDAYFVELQRRFMGPGALAAEAAGALHEGPWCHRCPSFVYCPAKTALARRLATGDEATELELLKPFDRQIAGLAWTRVREARSLLQRIENACMAALIEHGELELPDGRILKKVLAEGNEVLDGRVVYHVMEQMHGRAAAERAVTIHATKKAIDESLKVEQKSGTIPPRGRSEANKALLRTVRDRGGARKPMKERLAIIDPARPELVERLDDEIEEPTDG